jgi:hypothetical protein
MQTLNVGAGRTDNEYKAAEEQRRTDLRADSREDANYFFWAAGLAPISTGLLPVRLNILVNIGALDLLRLHGRPLGPLYLLSAYSAVATWLVVMVGLGFAGRSGQRRAFLAGMVLCGADMIALDRPHGHIFIVGIRGPRLLRIQMVPGTKSPERSERRGRIDLLIGGRVWALSAASVWPHRLGDGRARTGTRQYGNWMR